MSDDNRNKLYNNLNVSYIKFPKDTVLYRSINNIKNLKESFNPCIRGIFISNKDIACKYAELLGKSSQKKLHKYTLIQDTNVVDINWHNITLLLNFLKNVNTLSLRNSVTITSRDAINILKIYFTYKKKDKNLLLNPTEQITINTIKCKVSDWFSNIMAYIGFNGYLIDYGFNFSNSKLAIYPPEVYFCFPRLQLEYNSKPIICKKNSQKEPAQKFEPYLKK